MQEQPQFSPLAYMVMKCAELDSQVQALQAKLREVMAQATASAETEKPETD